MPRKYSALTISELISAWVSLLISGMFTWRIGGLSADFLSADFLLRRRPSWALSWSIAFSTVLVSYPRIARWVEPRVRPVLI